MCASFFRSGRPTSILIMQVTTLGQPLEVLKTQMAANRSQSMLQACKHVWARGGVAGFYQGLIPWVTICCFCFFTVVLTKAIRIGLDRSLYERGRTHLCGLRGGICVTQLRHKPWSGWLVRWHDWWNCSGLCDDGCVLKLVPLPMANVQN